MLVSMKNKIRGGKVKDCKKKRAIVIIMLVVTLIFGSISVYADSILQPGTPLAPEDWTWDEYELDESAQYPREHVPLEVTLEILQLVIGQYAYTINGESRLSDTMPFIAESRTMVPLRLIAEAMGADIEWDSDTRTVIITHGTMVASLVISQPLPNDLGTPIIYNDRTFVPLRFVAEALNATIDWDDETQSIEVVWIRQTVIGRDE